jgi:hypothetical protein
MQNRTSGLLVIVLAVGLISNGCTALGYGTGYSLDMNRAPYGPVEDVETLKAGDHVRITMINHEVINAIVKDAGDTKLIIWYLETDPEVANQSQGETRGLNLTEISQVEKKIPKKNGRKLLTALGVVGDILIVFVVLSFQNFDAINSL